MATVSEIESQEGRKKHPRKKINEQQDKKARKQGRKLAGFCASKWLSEKAVDRTGEQVNEHALSERARMWAYERASERTRQLARERAEARKQRRQKASEWVSKRTVQQASWQESQESSQWASKHTIVQAISRSSDGSSLPSVQRSIDRVTHLGRNNLSVREREVQQLNC